jgi:hypothetical protein
MTSTSTKPARFLEELFQDERTMTAEKKSAGRHAERSVNVALRQQVPSSSFFSLLLSLGKTVYFDDLR